MSKKELDKSYLNYEGDIPEAFSIPEDRIPPVHNQNIGTTDNRCMAYAMTGVMRIIHKVYTGKDLDFSEAYMYAKHRQEKDRIRTSMVLTDLLNGVVNQGCIPQNAMPDLKMPGESYDYVNSHPELDNIAKPYADIFKGYINLASRTKAEEFELIKKSLLMYQLPIYGEYVGHAIIFVGYKGDNVYYRDCDGSTWLKLLNYKDIKESVVFIMNDKKTTKFVDVPENHWATNAINEAVELGIVKGNDKNELNPDKPVTKAEVIQMLINMYHNK